MKRVIFLYLILLLNNGITGQTFYTQLALEYASEENYEKAVEIELEGMELWEKIHGKENLEYAQSLNNIAAYYSFLNLYQNSLQYAIDSLGIIEGVAGRNNKDYAKVLYNISLYLSQLGFIDKALEVGYVSYDIMVELYPENSKYILELLNNLMIYESEIGNCYDAIEIGEEIIRIHEEYQIYDDNYINVLGNLAGNYSSLGDNETALDIYNNLNDYFEKNSKINDSKYLGLLQNKALIFNEIGNYKEAIKLDEIILENLSKKDFPLQYAKCLNNIALSYRELSNFEISHEYMEQALSIIEQYVPESHPLYLTLLNNLATSFSDMGDSYKSIELSNKCLKLCRENFNSNNESLAFALVQVGINLLKDKEYYTSLDYLKEALSIINDLKGVDSFEYGQIIENISKINWFLNDYNTAIQNLSIASNIFEKKLGVNHPKYLKLLIEKILYCNSIQDTNEISKIIKFIIPRLNYNLISQFTFLSLQERKMYWDQNKNFYIYIVPYYDYTYPFLKLSEVIYNAILQSKSILISSEMEFDQFIGETGNEDLLKKYNEIKLLRHQLNKLYEKPIAERHCDTDSLERHVNELERKLMDESSEYGDYTKNLSVTWEDVQKGLGKKDAAIEFVHFPLNQDSTMYMAYVLRSEMESPAMVKLFEEKELKGVNEETLYSGLEGSKLVWEKLQSELEGVENVYFSPDGILHQIAIEYFPDYADSTRLISDRYRLNRLTSTRQLALKRDQGKTDKAIVYGGISYDTDPDIMETESRKYDRGKTRGIETYYNIADSLAGLRSGVRYLQFTMKEAENVNGLLSSGHYIPMLMSGNEATEESFKSLSGTRPGIMHIATHGFYWEEEEADRQAQINERLLFMSQFGDNARRNVEDKALTRTGLFMAGANNALSGKEIPEDIDDGVLTASEIANLDLRGTDLVVLSACQTGMGDISGDGVFGLQRGFKKAGINSILMSLWDVDDEATQILMTSFYQNYINGMTKQEALLEAQRKVRETPGFADPEYWAAFILLDALN